MGGALRVAMCCSVCCIACCSVSQCVAASLFKDLGVLQCVAMCCNMLQCVAACCSLLQRVAAFWTNEYAYLLCSMFTMHGIFSVYLHMCVCYSLLQCVAVCCSASSVALCSVCSGVV